jgi:hypothetical protein
MNPLILIRPAGHDTIKRRERKEIRRLVREEAISRVAGQLQIPAADRDRRSVSQTATAKSRRRELRERTNTCAPAAAATVPRPNATEGAGQN